MTKPGNETFEEWFQDYLLHRTASCLDRDILRWAKPILKEGFLQQESGCELKFKGARKYLEQQEKIDKLKAELERERKCVDYYADKSNWYDAGYSNSYTKINYDDYVMEESGGKLARETQKLRSDK